MWLVLIILNCFCVVSALFLLKKFLHLYQLKDYSNFRYLQHVFTNYFYVIFANILLAVLINILTNSIIKLLILIFTFTFNICLYFCIIKQKKTPIVYTGKLKRLYFISCLLGVACLIFYKILLFFQIFVIFLPILANFLNIFDKIKNFYYISQARRKLKNSNTKIIAITGSNGKTSVKNILNQILLKKYKVQATPYSYNTPLGISKFINNNLKSDCEFLILEYGARHRNDVKNLCKIFGADYGIVTTIAPQHLQTFKTIENIVKAKNELPKFLADKLCIFNLDNKHCIKMFNEKIGNKNAVSISKIADVYATDISIKNFKTKFNLHIKNSTYQIETKLLGNFNILNILLACSLALNLGVTISAIVDAISKLEPIPHRLEYSYSNLHILDDSYNCSLSSAQQAIKVLLSTKFKKMIVTPGIIEGGKNQYNLNFKLGKMCTTLDFVIIVGETNKKAILSGIKSQKYKCKIFTFKHLDDCKKCFSLLTNNDCLLFLNDLPDDYN